MTSRNQRIILKVGKQANKAIKALSDKKNTQRFAEFFLKDFVKRVRLGFGNDLPGNKKTKLKPLLARTIAKRRELRREGRLDRRTSPNRSNLTRTGQLLDSFGAKGKLNRFELVIENDVRTDTDKTNSEIILEQELQGRPFTSATDLEIKRLNSFVRKELLKEMRKQIKN